MLPRKVKALSVPLKSQPSTIATSTSNVRRATSKLSALMNSIHDLLYTVSRHIIWTIPSQAWALVATSRRGFHKRWDKTLAGWKLHWILQNALMLRNRYRKTLSLKEDWATHSRPSIRFNLKDRSTFPFAKITWSSEPKLRVISTDEACTSKECSNWLDLLCEMKISHNHERVPKESTFVS